MCWHLGGSQTDIANLKAEDIDWPNQTIAYNRQKTGSLAMILFGPDIDALLRQMPATGPLFPYMQSVRCGDRATEFKQRCDGLGIRGVSLHSYRYAWAERAKTMWLILMRFQPTFSARIGSSNCLRLRILQ